MATVVVHFYGNQLTSLFVQLHVLKDGKEVTVLNPAQVCAFGCSFIASLWLLASFPGLGAEEDMEMRLERTRIQDSITKGC